MASSSRYSSGIPLQRPWASSSRFVRLSGRSPRIYFQRSIGANEHQSGWIAATHQIGDKIEWRNALGLAQPILSSKILDVGEFLLIIRDEGVAEGKCLSRNEQVICADWSASLLKARAQQSVGSICRCLEGQNLKRTKHRFQLGGESR